MEEWWGIVLFVVYTFLHLNSVYLNTMWSGGTKFVEKLQVQIRGLPLTFAKMGTYGGVWANMVEFGLKYGKKGKTRGKFGGAGRSHSLYPIYIFAPKFS